MGVVYPGVLQKINGRFLKLCILARFIERNLALLVFSQFESGFLKKVTEAN
jgi:hypothetical protein